MNNTKIEEGMESVEIREQFNCKKSTNLQHKLKYIEYLKLLYPTGTKIQCIQMNDPFHPIPFGMIGIVNYIDDMGIIHMKWENGSSLGLIPGEDQFKVI